MWYMYNVRHIWILTFEENTYSLYPGGQLHVNLNEIRINYNFIAHWSSIAEESRMYYPSMWNTNVSKCICVCDTEIRAEYIVVQGVARDGPLV